VPGSGSFIARLSAEDRNSLLLHAMDHSWLVRKSPESRVHWLNQLQESESREVDLQDDDPTVFEHLLSYLYTLDYDDGFRPEEYEGSSSSDVRGNNAAESGEDNPAVIPSAAVIKADSQRSDLSDSGEIGAVIPFPEHSEEGKKSSLMINVQVYAIADKFDMPELKVLAKEKFLKCAQGWPLPDFPSVVHEALSSTPESDLGLRDIIKRILADHLDDVYPFDDLTSTTPSVTATKTIRATWRNALRDEGAFLYRVLGYVAANKAYEQARLQLTNVEITADLQIAQHEVLTLKSTIEQLRREQASCEMDLDAVKDRGARLIREIDTRSHCRHCSKDFQMSFEDATYDDWYHLGSLRCKKCRTKHAF